MEHSATPTLHGLMAEFETPTGLVEAATKARLAGYRKMDAYSPIPIEELNEALALRRTRLPLLVLIGGILGCAGGFGLASWVSAIAYPMDVGGRPLISWPQFIPVTFETTVLGAALTAFFGMWALNKLPQPYHPVFNVPAFGRASTDRFFLVIESGDPRFDRTATWQFLENLHPVGVSEVAP
jgi:ActD protein